MTNDFPFILPRLSDPQARLTCESVFWLCPEQLELKKKVSILPERGQAGRGVWRRGRVRESLLYFSLKDATPYFSRASLLQRNVLRPVGDAVAAAGSRGRDLRPRGVYVVMRDPRPA